MAGIEAFVTTLVTNLVIALIVLLLFSYLRAKHPKTYAPRVHHFKTNKPPPLDDGMFSWIMAMIRMPKEDMLRYGGTDAYMFTLFARFGVKLFGTLFIIGAIAILPTNIEGTNKDLDSDDAAFVEGFDILSMSNVEEEDPTLWVHAISVYLFSAITFYFLLQTYKDYTSLRHAHLSREAVENYTVAVFGLDDDIQSNADLRARFEKIVPGQVDSVSLVRDAVPLDKLQNDRNTFVVKLENANATFHKKGERPTHKENAKCFCIGGEPVDSINHYSESLSRATAKLVEERAKDYPVVATGLVTLKSLFAAQVLSQSLNSANPASLVRLAPEPRDVLWNNLSKSENSKIIRTRISNLLVFLLVFFWTIPVAFVSSLSNLRGISETDGFGWIDDILDISPVITGLLEGMLPTIVLAVFMAVLPIILGALTRFEGVPSNSDVEFGVVTKFFLFQLFNVFLTTTIAGTYLSDPGAINSASAGTVIDLLATSLPTVATFFTNYIFLQGLGVLPMLAFRVGPLIVSKIKLKFLAKSERAKYEVFVAGAGQMKYGTLLPPSILVVIISLVYSTINPIICFAAFLYFGLAFLIFSYNFVYVYKRSFETGGGLWPLVFNRILIGVYIYQITLIGLLGLKKAPGPAAVIFPTPIFTYAVSWYAKRMFENPGSNLPLDRAREIDSERGSWCTTQHLANFHRIVFDTEESVVTSPSTKSTSGIASSGAGAGAGAGAHPTGGETSPRAAERPATLGESKGEEEASRPAEDIESLYVRPSMIGRQYDLELNVMLEEVEKVVSSKELADDGGAAPSTASNAADAEAGEAKA